MSDLFFQVPPDNAQDAERYMQRILAMFASASVQKELVWIETQLKMLLPGESLCVHPRQSEFGTDVAKGWTYTWTTSAHVLPKDNVCSQQGQRFTYGPMPACRTEGCTLRYGHPADCAPRAL